MKRYTLPLLLCLLWIQSIGQTCDSIKRQAVVWVIQRNECRELLNLADARINLLEQADSLNRLALAKYIHSTDVLGKALVESEQNWKEEYERAEQWKAKAGRRLWLMPLGVAIGFVIALL